LIVADVAPTLRAGGNRTGGDRPPGTDVDTCETLIAYGGNNTSGPRDGSAVGALRAASGGSSRDYVAATAVRRLTPTECERLQGFPDNWTQVPFRGKPAADGPRYKALGNSWAVNCARWIGRRIEMVEQINAAQKAAA
jgi:DNA (cytosine-5)-methyltransferase 1